MDLLDRTREGFRTIPVDEANKERALKYLRQWLAETGFTAYRPQLHWLIETKQWTGLLDRFYQILPFGTGGRRGAVGVGPNRMNAWTLGASVQGHCEYLKERFPDVTTLRVAVAYDVRCFQDKRRNYNPDVPNPVLGLSSKDLAHYAVGVYVANGIHAITLPADSKRYLATPELSFAIRSLKAHGGLNISASHNPPDDNGGKFYDERGGQPVSPDDQIMADLVEQVDVVKSLTWKDALRSGKVGLLDDSTHEAYIELIRHQSVVPAPKFDEFKVVFTPLHGVGSMTAMEVLVKQGFRVCPVEEQMSPDGQFPNVTKTPNPEVPESMDRAAATARRENADLVLSTDPDADRLGAMIPDRHGGWRFLNGNEIAALLTHFKLGKLAQQGCLPRAPIVIRTEVTTSLVSRIARHFKAQVVEDLQVGFKFIANVLWHLEQSGRFEDVRGTPEDFVIASEESHGILVTPKIRDKDAGGAALLLAELALDQKRQRRTVLDYLESLWRQFGYFRNEGVPVVMTGIMGKENIARMLEALRKTPPKKIAGLSVTSFKDFRDPNGPLGPIKGETDAAGRNLLVFQLGEKAKVVLRPSGTEPKAKSYIEVCSDPCPQGSSVESWQRTCAELDGLLALVSTDFLQKALGNVGMTLADAGIR
jgi:phosphoglucomutase/phosphomannomutase